MKSKLIILAAGTVAALSTASAVTITSPMTLNQQFIVGIHDGQEADSSIPTETLIAQAILNLSLGEDNGPYHANNIYDYSGIITSNGGQLTTGIEVGGDDVVNIAAGWGGALAKYDGPNGGYVLFLFNGEASTIPEFPYDFWTSELDKYQISHYTLFSGSGNLTPGQQSVVPEGGPGVAMLGGLLLALGGAHKLAARRALA